MSADPRKDPPNEPAPGTLGALLYAQTAAEPPPERVWIDLVEAIAAGDQGALHALYDRTHRIAFTLIMRIVHHRPTAEEVTLDVFHDVWRRASGYDPTSGTVVGWVMNQARSRAIDRLRHDHRQKRTPPSTMPPAPTSTDGVSALEQRDRIRRLRVALADLPAPDRQAIETAFFGELTHTDAAARLHQPLGTLKTRIRLGLRKLRVALEEQGP